MIRRAGLADHLAVVVHDALRDSLLDSEQVFVALGFAIFGEPEYFRSPLCRY